MAKRFSITNFIFVSILVAFGIFLSVFSFKIPFYVNDFASFAGAIPLGYDIGQGQSAVFKLKPASQDVSSLSQAQIDDTLDFVEKVVADYNGTLYQIGLQNDDMIRVDIPKSDTSEDFMLALSKRVEIVVRSEDSSESTNGAVEISADRIKKCYASYQTTGMSSTSYSLGVIIEFDNLGKNQLKELTKSVKSDGNTLYFYNTDGEKIGSYGDITRTISSGVIFMPVSSLTTENDANMYAINVMMGASDAKLNITENSVTSSFIGYNSLTYVIVTLLVSFVIISLFMIIRYRDLGLLSVFTSLINIVLYLFFLQALPIVTLTLSGIIGCAFGFVATILCHIIIFENIKKEYKLGRKIPLAFKLGFKNSLLKVVDISAVLTIMALVLYFIGYQIIKSFAIGLFLGGILSIFSSLVVTKSFTKWYLPLNSTNAKHLNLKREKANEKD